MRGVKFLLLFAVLFLAGCDSRAWEVPDFGLGFSLPVFNPNINRFTDPLLAQRPVVKIPQDLRQHNWRGSKGEGSCVHASIVMAFRAQSRLKTADWWRSHNGNGEWDSDLATKFDRAGIRYAYTSGTNDVAWLDQLLSTRRPCGVTVMGGRHMILLVHFDQKWAGLIDNNDPSVIKWVPRATFLAEWRNSGSWAVAPIYTPSPPRVPVNKS